MNIRDTRRPGGSPKVPATRSRCPPEKSPAWVLSDLAVLVGICRGTAKKLGKTVLNQTTHCAKVSARSERDSPSSTNTKLTCHVASPPYQVTTQEHLLACTAGRFLDLPRSSTSNSSFDFLFKSSGHQLEIAAHASHKSFGSCVFLTWAFSCSSKKISPAPFYSLSFHSRPVLSPIWMPAFFAASRKVLHTDSPSSCSTPP